MDDERLDRLIGTALDALSTDRRRLGISLTLAGGRTIVDLRGHRITFGLGARDRLLAWERLADLLPRSVELTRLEAMHAASSEAWPAPWSVHSTETTVRWLKHGPGAATTFTDASRAILDAADRDGEVALDGPGGVAALRGTLRSRRFRARIRLGLRLDYDSSVSNLRSRDIVPETLSGASAGKPVAELIDIPWLAASSVTARAVSPDATGTTFALMEALFPLSPIPPASLKAMPIDAPTHAPWSLTDAERRDLDELDAHAHREG